MPPPRQKAFVYLHVGDLILLPVESLHLVFFKLQASLYILIVISLERDRRTSDMPRGAAPLLLAARGTVYSLCST